MLGLVVVVWCAGESVVVALGWPVVRSLVWWAWRRVGVVMERSEGPLGGCGQADTQTGRFPNKSNFP